ncbi:hypothetical protein, partial [Bradyrhizobium sp. Leo121]|uniref:hypothetical protein n=1 Tax=Bradyrhizobium sp. Leo121 TaxID=1571195 RepID=UPI001A920080
SKRVESEASLGRKAPRECERISLTLFESNVGWVERSETHHSRRLLHRDGFRFALPIRQAPLFDI